MSRIKQLKQDKADTIAKMREISQKLGNALLSEEDRAALKAELKTLDAKCETLIEDLQIEERLADRERSQGGARDDDSIAAGRAAANSGITVRDRAEDDPKRGFKDHKEYLTAVMNQASGKGTDPRLKPLAAAGSDEQGTHSDPHGGFLLPVAFSPALLTVDPEDDPTVGRTTSIPMNAPMIKINARVDKNHSTSVSGGFTVTRRPETVAGTGSRMQTEKIGLEAHELFGLGYATETILTDSPQSFIAIIEKGFKDEMAAHMLEEKLHGTGAGEYLGVLNANNPCLVTVAKETGQAADSIVKANIDKMRARCWRYGRAVWLANHDTLPQLRSIVQEVGTGGAPVAYFSVTTDGQAILDGRPLFFTEFASTIGDVGDLVLGVWSEFLEGQYQGLQQAESVHVRFEYNERAFKFFLRNDGQPWWRSPLTPKRGSGTLSPFVTLAAR